MKNTPKPRKAAAILLSFCLALCMLASIVPVRAENENTEEESPLSGLLKACEQLGQAAKEFDLQEFLDSNETIQALKSFDPKKVAGMVKELTDATRELSDDEAKALIRSAAEQEDIRLTDTQVDQLLTLCRAVEKLDEIELEKKLEALQEAVKKLQDSGGKMKEAGEKAEKAAGTVRRFTEKAKTVFHRVNGFLSDFFAKMA